MCVQRKSELCTNCGKCCNIFDRPFYPNKKAEGNWTRREFIEDWKSEFKKEDLKKTVRPWFGKSKKCPYLTAKGCKLPVKRRPKTCNDYLCDEAIRYNKKKGLDECGNNIKIRLIKRSKTR